MYSRCVNQHYPETIESSLEGTPPSLLPLDINIGFLQFTCKYARKPVIWGVLRPLILVRRDVLLACAVSTDWVD